MLSNIMSISNKYRTLLRTVCLCASIEMNRFLFMCVRMICFRAPGFIDKFVYLWVPTRLRQEWATVARLQPLSSIHLWQQSDDVSYRPASTHTYLPDTYQNIPGWVHINRRQLHNDRTNEWNNFLSGFQFKICAIICEYKYVFNIQIANLLHQVPSRYIFQLSWVARFSI